MQQYRSTGEHDGAQNLVISAEQLGEDAGELAGFWHVVDANGVEGHITDEMFQANWQPLTAKADTAAAPPSGKK